MFRMRFICLLLAVCSFACLCTGAAAVEMESESVYCFQVEDFSQEEGLVGICITELPDAEAGTVMLGRRVLRPGDILTTEQVSQMTFVSLESQMDSTATITYLPIYENVVQKAVTMTISIRGKINQPPVAEDMAMETYKNLPNDGKLKVSDPEGGELTYTVIRKPKRGTVEIREDGGFTYTPKKNKVGTDSFTFTATDPQGNVSRTATVTVQILKPADGARYADTVGTDHRFTAEWMKNTGLFVGEQVGGSLCFNGDKTVSRGDFLVMMVKALEIPVDKDATYTGYTDEVADWLKPYLAAAMRSGLTAGVKTMESGVFGVNEPITWAEAAMMLQNAMDLSVTTAVVEEELTEEELEYVWAMEAVMAMQDNGVAVSAPEVLKRSQVADILYRVSKLAEDAPGLQIYQ